MTDSDFTACKNACVNEGDACAQLQFNEASKSCQLLSKIGCETEKQTGWNLYTAAKSNVDIIQETSSKILAAQKKIISAGVGSTGPQSKNPRCEA